MIYDLVIIPNHIHLVWQIQDGYKQDNILIRFLKFTAQQMKFKLTDTNDPRLDLFLVNAKDRKHQFWEPNSLSIELWTPAVFMQKLDYIHYNPLQNKWRLAEFAEDYKYSSAKCYESGYDEHGLITHYDGQEMNIKFVGDNTNKGESEKPIELVGRRSIIKASGQ